jgi:hypothetical protein
MCPDRDLLSAYADGETPSPWKEKLQSHLAACENCTKILRNLRQVSDLLQSLPGPVFADATALKSAALERLSWPGRRPLWRTRVALPLPAALAAGVAMVLLGMSLTLALRPVQVTPSIPGLHMSVLSTGPINVTSQVKDLKNLIKMLNNEKSGRELIIQLPEQQLFNMGGEPQFIRVGEPRRDF